MINLVLFLLFGLVIIQIVNIPYLNNMFYLVNENLDSRILCSMHSLLFNACHFSSQYFFHFNLYELLWIDKKLKGKKASKSKNFQTLFLCDVYSISRECRHSRDQFFCFLREGGRGRGRGRGGWCLVFTLKDLSSFFLCFPLQD